MRKNVPDDVKSLVDEAAALERDSRYESALEIHHAAIARRPDVAVLHNNLGCCLANLGRYEEAKQAFLIAITKTQFNRSAGIEIPDSYPEEPAQNLRAAQAQLNGGLRGLFTKPFKRFNLK